jgi:hypothetical protein
MNLEKPQTDAPAKPLSPAEAPRPGPRQAVSGLTPPQVGEAVIREVRPGVKAFLGGGPANLGRLLLGLPSVVAGKLPSVPVVTAVLWPIVWTVLALPLLPLAWLMLLPGFVMKFHPFICRRYTLTNRRLMIQRGLKPRPIQEIALADIDDVRLEKDTFDEFFLSANLDVISKGQVSLKLAAAPEPESLRLAILNAVRAWVPGKVHGPFVPASAKT